MHSVLPILALVGALLALIFGLLFAVARADWAFRGCAEWPEANQCADAVGSMWFFGLVVVVALIPCVVWGSRRLNA